MGEGGEGVASDLVLCRSSHGHRIPDPSHWSGCQAWHPRALFLEISRDRFTDTTSSAKALAVDQGAARALDCDWRCVRDDACLHNLILSFVPDTVSHGL